MLFLKVSCGCVLVLVCVEGFVVLWVCCMIFLGLFIGICGVVCCIGMCGMVGLIFFIRGFFLIGVIGMFKVDFG